MLGAAALTPTFTVMLLLSGAGDAGLDVAVPGVLGVGPGAGAPGAGAGAGDLLADLIC